MLSFMLTFALFESQTFQISYRYGIGLCISSTFYFPLFLFFLFLISVYFYFYPLISLLFPSPHLFIFLFSFPCLFYVIVSFSFLTSSVCGRPVTDIHSPLPLLSSRLLSRCISWRGRWRRKFDNNKFSSFSFIFSVFLLPSSLNLVFRPFHCFAPYFCGYIANSILYPLYLVPVTIVTIYIFLTKLVLCTILDFPEKTRFWNIRSLRSDFGAFFGVFHEYQHENFRKLAFMNFLAIFWRYLRFVKICYFLIKKLHFLKVKPILLDKNLFQVLLNDE